MKKYLKEIVELQKLFRKYQVKNVKSLDEFMSAYYKADRYTGRGIAYENVLLEAHREHLDKEGFDIISKHDSNTGEVVAFYKK